MSERKRISIGVGAVVFRGEEVLIIKRGKPPFEGEWSIPGGRLEYGERVKDAVIREVREETALEIELIGLLDVFDAFPETAGDASPAHHTVIIDYVAEWREGEPIAGDDARDAAFVDIETAISRFSWDVTREAILRAKEIRDAAQKSRA